MYTYADCRTLGIPAGPVRRSAPLAQTLAAAGSLGLYSSSPPVLLPRLGWPTTVLSEKNSVHTASTVTPCSVSETPPLGLSHDVSRCTTARRQEQLKQCGEALDKENVGPTGSPRVLHRKGVCTQFWWILYPRNFFPPSVTARRSRSR
jgi:hypothetical protein